MKKIINIFLLIVGITFFAACSKDTETTPDPEKTKIAESTTTSGLTVSLWSDQTSYLVAYNKVYVQVKKADGSSVTNATVTYSPLMDMTTMKHSSPVEQPVYNTSDQLYEGAVVFSMPSGMMGSWGLTVKVNNESLVFNVSVNATVTNTKHTGTFLGTDGKSYSVSLVQPSTPKIGMNDLEILVNVKQDMLTFPPDAGLTIEVTPEMPSMGHGSPNNVNPVSSSNGHYKGKVNFTMSGDWRLHLKLLRNNTVIVEDAALDLLF
ncbi:FixH family protein [Arcticibacter eurypsychrophilus]|uniref:FixH family protein n=1 Tax=Arcticibacter eurypsychrophilus TaxID=1434752 RepID=UPI00084D106A|nr:FixH family protein [Arcticibacter eurypsychrophilus]